MFKAPKPAGQPRSLRSIAEAHNQGANFPTEPELPEGSPIYDDPGEAAKPSTSTLRRSKYPTDPSPFANLKG